MTIEQVVKKFTDSLEFITSEICRLEGHTKDLKMVCLVTTKQKNV